MPGTGSGQPESYWDRYRAADWSVSFPPGTAILDVGCGPGDQMVELAAQGYTVTGVEISAELVAHCRARGLNVQTGEAEHLPVADASVDGVLCKVVIPLTIEDQTVYEIARVLRPGGRCFLISHGAGYYLRYLLQPPTWKHALYGARTLVNTWVWALLHTRLPGFLGDTLYQSRRRLDRYYRRSGLRITSESKSDSYLGFPVFLHQVLVREQPGPR